MKGSAALVFAVALVTPSGCALVGFDISDYGGTSDGGGGDASDATVDVPAADVPTFDAVGDVLDGDGPVDAGHDSDGSSSDGAPEVGADADSGGDATREDAAGNCSLSSVKRVFVTSVQYTVAGVASLANADVLCQKLASPHISGTYRAWLSDDVTSAAQRLTHSTVPYVLVDGATLVACDWTALVSGTLKNAIDKDEAGGAAPTSPGCGAITTELGVWTGTTPQGDIATGDTCASWTSGLGNAIGLIGFAQAVDQTWSDGCSGAVCTNSASLYCLEQ